MSYYGSSLGMSMPSRRATMLKIGLWCMLVTAMLVGSVAMASWDAGIVHNIVQSAYQGNSLSGVTSISGSMLSEVGQESVSNEQTIMYLNDRQYVDIQQVRDTWLQWTNYLRTQQLGGRDAYTTDRRLNMTAQAWSDYSASIGSISHRRRASDGYYNYNGLVQWFRGKGEELTGSPIVFQNVSRATFSESIGRGMRSCREADCTDEVIEATRSTWNFFYGERSYNGVHYRALIHRNFGIQGLGIAFSGRRYFLTIHYGTSIID